MKKTILITILIALSISAFGQTRARTGISIGDHKESGTNVTVIDSATIEGTDIKFFQGADTLNPYVPASGYDDLYNYTLNLADSNVVNGGYVTPTGLETELSGIDLSDYINIADSAKYINKDFLTLRITGTTATLASIPLAESSGCGAGFATNSSTDMTDGRAVYQAVYLAENKTITGVEFLAGDNGDFTGDEFNGVALYSYSAGNITQVAISANNANIWKASSGTVIKAAFTAPYVATKGLYYVGILYSESAHSVVPELFACSATAVTAITDLVVYQSSQTALLSGPTSVAGLTAFDQLFWFILY